MLKNIYDIVNERIPIKGFSIFSSEDTAGEQRITLLSPDEKTCVLIHTVDNSVKITQFGNA